MFYLKECLKIFKENLILSVLFFLSTAVLISVSHQRNELKSALSLSSAIGSLPYFNALLTNGPEMATIVRRMKKLPGVASVVMGSHSSIQSEIAKLKATFGKEVIQGLTSLNYRKIKINLNNNLRLKSQTLIREYLTRLVGRSSITLGDVKIPQPKKSTDKGPINLLLNRMDIYIYLLFGGLWLISVVLLLKPINKISFIVEKFQRKTNTNIKILFSGFILISTPVIFINYYLNRNSEILTAFTVILMLVLLFVFSFGSGKKLKYKK